MTVTAVAHLNFHGQAREALVEREVLLRAMPHIAWPMRFVLPYHPDMRFEGQTPMSRILSTVLPWMRGRRPAWLIRLGLFVYDHLGGRKKLPATRTLNLRQDPAGRPLKGDYAKGFEYSDCWVDDARLVVLNARSAQEKGAEIRTRTKVTGLHRRDGVWDVDLTNADGSQDTVTARLVDELGPDRMRRTMMDLGMNERP